VVAFARGLGIDPTPDRGRFLYEVTRLVYETPELRNPSAAAFLQALRQAIANRTRVGVQGARPSSDVVPVPLTSQVWGGAIFHRHVASGELLQAIVADRLACLLAHGLSMLDDRTLEYFVEHPSLLTRLYERSAAPFAAFASSLRINDKRVVPPGDSDAVAL